MRSVGEHRQRETDEPVSAHLQQNAGQNDRARSRRSDVRIRQPVCTGHIGIFTANEAKKASHSHFCMSGGKCVMSSTVMSVVPATQYIAMMASNISTDPRKV